MCVCTDVARGNKHTLRVSPPITITSRTISQPWPTDFYDVITIQLSALYSIACRTVQTDSAAETLQRAAVSHVLMMLRSCAMITYDGCNA
jgi:hypothetical protein